MSKNKSFSLALLLALAFAVCAPQTALGSRVLYAPAPVVSEPTPQAAAADAPAEQSEKPKSKGNAFARALTAPFRALARLFGSGKKSDNEQARKRETTPATTATQAADAAVVAPAQGAPAAVAHTDAAAAESQGAPRVESASVEGSKSPSPSEAQNAAAREADALARGIVSGASSSEQTRVVRPAEAAAALPKPGMWIPVIKGISRDPLTQGRALLEHGYIQEAISELTIAASTVGPELVEANNLLGLAYDRMGWHLQAVAAYERALTVAPKDPVVTANLGNALFLANDHAGALKRLRRAAKLAPGMPVIHNNLAIVLASAGRYGEAFKSFTRASNEFDAHIKLAEIHEAKKQDRDAIKHYEAALRMQPGTSAILERLVAVYERTGQHNKADTARRTLGQPKNPQRTTTGGGG